MKERGSALIFLLFGILLLAVLIVSVNFLLPRYTNLPSLNSSDGSSSNSITAPIDQAQSVAAQADLKSIETALQVYFSEYGRYPLSLDELKSQGQLNPGINTNNYTYQVCDGSGGKALIFSDGTGSGTYLNFGESSPTQSDTC